MIASTISLVLAGRISPEIGLARLVLGGVTPEEIRRDLAIHDADPAAGPMLDLVARHPERLDRLATVFAGTELDHARTADADLIAQVASAYDIAVTRSPEASVASYSLGDPGTLNRATDEIVAWLVEASLLPQGAVVLDSGSGIGRVAVALLPRARSVLGLDVSVGMVAEARRRHQDPRLQFELTEGRHLADLPPAAFDLILAVDSFPYLVQAGVAAMHIAGAAQALRPGGAICVLNLSYRGNAEADLQDALCWTAECGLSLERAGEKPFRIWDADAWVFRRAAGAT